MFVVTSVRDHAFRALCSAGAQKMAAEPLFALRGLRRSGYPDRFPDDCERILVVRTDGIGDFVLGTPLLKELRALFREAELDLLVDASVYDLACKCPYVDRVIDSRRTTLRRGNGLRWLASAWRFAAGELWPRHYDLAVMARWDSDMYADALPGYLSGARYRLGHWQHARGRYRNLYTHVVRSPQAVAHEVTRAGELVRYLGGEPGEPRVEVWVDESDERAAERLLPAVSAERGRVRLAVCLSAGEPKKRWPGQRYASTLAAMAERYRVEAVFLGGPDAVEDSEACLEQSGCAGVNLAGRTSLRETAAVVKRCTLYLGNDTGTMHIAAAVGIPVVALSCHPLSSSGNRPNSPVRFAPWGVPARVLQPDRPLAPCVDSCRGREPHCITGLGVNAVVEALDALLAGGCSEGTGRMVEGEA